MAILDFLKRFQNPGPEKTEKDHACHREMNKVDKIHKKIIKQIKQTNHILKEYNGKK